MSFELFCSHMNFVVHIILLFFYGNSTSYKSFQVKSTSKLCKSHLNLQSFIYKIKQRAVPQKCASIGPHSELKYIARI